ncbi:MAG: hypothetical protein FWD03_00725 [Defluviitaleaceae bacterium]|nr:hypothetical protein [Defluviitaleaceae bacterium]
MKSKGIAKKRINVAYHDIDHGLTKDVKSHETKIKRLNKEMEHLEMKTKEKLKIRDERITDQRKEIIHLKEDLRILKQEISQARDRDDRERHWKTSFTVAIISILINLTFMFSTYVFPYLPLSLN